MTQIKGDYQDNGQDGGEEQAMLGDGTEGEEQEPGEGEPATQDEGAAEGFDVFNPADADLIPLERVIKATPPRVTPKYKVIQSASGGDVIYRPKRVRGNKGWAGYPFDTMKVSRVLADGAIQGVALQIEGADMRSAALNAFNRYRQVHPEFTARTATLGVNPKTGATVFGLWKLRTDPK
jgi:hypothetical protein